MTDITVQLVITARHLRCLPMFPGGRAREGYEDEVVDLLDTAFPALIASRFGREFAESEKTLKSCPEMPDKTCDVPFL